MGCDIHPRIQVKAQYDAYWRTVGVPDDSRWYPFFELLTGQREHSGFAGVLDPERGLPEALGVDADYGQLSADSFGDHSFTWWTLDEMKAARPKAVMACKKIEIPPHATSAELLARFDDWIALGEMLGKQHEADGDGDVRYVIGYDS